MLEGLLIAIMLVAIWLLPLHQHSNLLTGLPNLIRAWGQFSQQLWDRLQLLPWLGL